MKLRSTLGAATAVALMMALSACGGGGGQADASASEHRVATAPEGRVMSPGAVAQQLQGRGFTPSAIRRRGSNYVVDARGPSGNTVRMVVDGKRGVVRGLDVLEWAPGRSRIARGSRGARFVNDSYEYGLTVSDALLADWVVYDGAQWVTTEAWIEYDEVTEFSWSEVTYESSIQDVSYEAYEQAYGEITSYEESFYEESSWSEAYGDSDFGYEDEAAYREDLSEEYGEAYADDYASEDFSETYDESQADGGYEDSGADDSYADAADDSGGDASYDDGGGSDGGGEE